MSSDGHMTAKDWSGLLTDCDGLSSGYSNNICAAVFAVAAAINRLAKATEKLGTNDATDPRGAVELVAMEIRNGFECLADASRENAEAISGLGQELHGIGQEIGWGLDPDDSRQAHLVPGR